MKWPPDRNTLLIGGGAAVLLIGWRIPRRYHAASGKHKATASTEKALPPGEAGLGPAAGEAAAPPSKSSSNRN